MEIVQQVAAKALIVKDGKVLIIREASTYGEGTQRGRYQVPGGRVELGEHFEDALHREVREETGLAVTIGYPIYVGEWSPIIKAIQKQIIAVYVVCTTATDDAISLSSEHDDFQWIMPEQHAGFDIVSPESLVIERYVAWSKKLQQ